MNKVVAVIPNVEGGFLFIKKSHYNNQFACIAGHVQENEKLEDAAKREAREEAGIEIKSLKLIFNKNLKYTCKYGHDSHDFFLFEAECDGKEGFKSDEGEIILLTKEEMQDKPWLETTRGFLKEAGYIK